jgi:2-polyprenyl-6-methoxyphenol hydroxylase-like FAD-dependent oxidoreductase
MSAMRGGYDAVVVGGRVAGASTALLLARAGARVAVVERSRPGQDTVSTHGLMRAGVLQLSRWGVLPRVVEAGTPPVTSTLFHYGKGATTRVSIRPRAGVEALFATRRYLLDAMLLEAAAEAGAEVLHETAVTALLHDGSGRVRGVRATDRKGRRLELPAAMTIGADGLRSTVAEAVRAPTVRRGRTASAVLYRYVADLPSDGYEWAYGAGAAAGLLPTNNGETCVFVSATPDRARALRRSGAERAFAALLDQASAVMADRVRAAGAAGRLHGWAGAAGCVRRSWGPGWALVGDAGYFKDPITTHGMTDALRDAELLTRAIVGAGDETQARAKALARYEATRDRLSRDLFAATEAVAAYDWDAEQIQSLLRRVSSAMSDEVAHLESLAGTDNAPVQSGKAADTAWARR